VYLGGSFTLYNKTSSNRIVLLKSDGSVDTAFNVGTGFAGVEIMGRVVVKVNSIPKSSDRDPSKHITVKNRLFSCITNMSTQPLMPFEPI